MTTPKELTTPTRSPTLAGYSFEMDEWDETGGIAMMGSYGRRSRFGTGRSTLAGAAVALFIAGSCSSTGSQASSEVSPVSDASESSTDVITIPSCDTVPCQGPLEPGAYRTDFYEHPITYEFTVSDPGWTWYYSGTFRIVTGDTPTDGLTRSSEGVYVLRDPVAASSTCEEVPEPGVGRSVDDLAAWLEQQPGLDVSGRQPVTISGLRGLQMDLVIDPDWTKTCSFSERLPAVPLVVNNSDFAGYHLAIVPGLSMRWFLLPWDDGTILVDIDNSRGRMSADELLRAATPIVASFVFSPA